MVDSSQPHQTGREEIRPPGRDEKLENQIGKSEIEINQKQGESFFGKMGNREIAAD